MLHIIIHHFILFFIFIANGDQTHHCKYLENEDKLVVAAGPRIGCRSTYGEQIFLQTILNPTNVSDDGEVTIELNIAKVC